MVNFKNGVTPINDTNLNKIQADLQAEIDKLKGVVLYEDTIGTNSSITFNEQLNEGDLIEIIYCRRRVAGTSVFKSTGKIPYTEGMEIALDMNYYSSDINQQIIAKLVVVNSGGITVTGETNITNLGAVTATSNIYITKAIKYKEA